MIRALLQEQQDSLQPYFSQLDCAKTEEIVKVLSLCKGTLVLSGVGKSGHIAQKIAATLLSIGIKAYFLDPIHAIHGDLGFVSESDFFLAFSKSGESQEVLSLVSFVRKKGAKLIAIVSQKESKLAQVCDDCIVLPVERELCPFNLAPTISTTVQLLFGDLLAMALMRIKQVSLSDYALNHPGGFIGRCISLRVSDLMLQGEAIPLCRPTDRLIDLLHDLSAKRCGCLLIVDEVNRLMGIFTDGDLRRCLAKKGAAVLEATVETVMTVVPRMISSSALALEAMRKMEEDPSRLIAVLPVLESDQVVGLIRLHDILQAGL